MSDSPVARNRLDEASSPYLRQHADNPVHWQPWDELALDAAREQDKPIFLSIGYSACHWCHVMEDESFEDDGVAEIMNEAYIPIKVDREERPDLDRIYQTICQLVTRSGGWPLSVWLTPDGRPFYVGTYFPKEDRYGRPGFKDLLEGLAGTWEEDRDGIEDRATQWVAAIRDEVEPQSDRRGPPPQNALVTAADAAVRSADPDNGGFGTSGPKFPQPTRIDLLFRAYHDTNTPGYETTAVRALDAMATRGLYDHVGGGFHRYTVDPEWTVPHFEKMLYDNAELTRVFLTGYQLTGDDQYARAVRETLAFVERELTHPDGGFYSTLDAQSEGEEGAFYVWTPDEIRDAIPDPETADLFIDRYGVTAEGNFEGKTVLTIIRSHEDLADDHGLTTEAVESRLDTAREHVFTSRSDRPRPHRDEKVLAGWNGLMISGFAHASLTLDPEYLATAERALAFTRDHHWDDDQLSRRYKDGTVGIDGYLEDYAFLARAALDTYQASGRLPHLEYALRLADRLVTLFWDPDDHALYFTPAHAEPLIARPQELTDQSTPSSAGTTIELLTTLAHFTTDDRLTTVAEHALETYGPHINANPLLHAALVLATDRHTRGSHELTITGSTYPEDWRATIGRTFLPRRLITYRPPHLADWLEQLGYDSSPPVWAGRDPSDSEPVAYACQDFACSPPHTTIEDALDWFTSPDPGPATDPDLDHEPP